MGNAPWERHQGVKKKDKGKKLRDEKQQEFGEEAGSFPQTPFMLQLLPAPQGALCWC